MPSLATRALWNAFTLWHVRAEKKLPYRPLAEILELQSLRVRAVVAHAYREVPFYRDAMDQRGLKPADFHTAANLAKLPLIDAKTFCAQPQRFSAGKLARRPGLTIDSSGTSGLGKRLRYDARALFLALAQGHRQRIVFSHFLGKLLGYREMSFTRLSGMSGQIRHFYESYSWTPPAIDLKRRKLAAGGLSVEETAAAINEFCPDLIVGYGSYIGMLFREMHRRKLEVYRPKLISYGADAMNESDRCTIEREFGIPVVSTYQTAEALRIGFYCEQRRGFHLSLDAVAVRLVDEEGGDVAPGQAGHVVLSNLTNRATVLLNYRLGDVARFSAGACPCGRTLPVLELLQGRSDDLIQFADGRRMHALTVLEGLQRVPEVLQVQIVQHALPRFTVRAVGQAAVNPEEASAALIRELRSKIGEGAHVAVQWLETIPPEPNGKLKAVISEIPES